MADSAVAVTAGSGTNIDTRTEGTNGNHRQVVVIGDPATNAGVAPVDATDGMSVLANTTGKYVDVTLSLDTSAYADGDLLADTQVVTGAFRKADGTGVIQSIQVLDEDDQGVAMDLVFLSANNTLGSENSAPSVSDANARDILGRVRVNAADYIDLGGCRIATLLGVGMGVKAASGTANMYVAAITRGGTPTYTASGVRLRIYVASD